MKTKAKLDHAINSFVFLLPKYVDHVSYMSKANVTSNLRVKCSRFFIVNI